MLTKEDDDMADLHLSDGEWKLMKVLWQQSPRTLGALVAALAPTTGWSKATVFMMLKRLIAKGAVTLDESGKYQQYSAAVAYAEVEPEETASFLTKVYGGSVGLMVSNLVGLMMGANPAGAWDILLGPLATLIAALLTYRLRGAKIKGLPVLATLPPVLVNAVVIGLELTIAFYGFSWPMAGLNMLYVGLGQLAACTVCGLVLYAALDRSGAAKLVFGK